MKKWKKAVITLVCVLLVIGIGTSSAFSYVKNNLYLPENRGVCDVLEYAKCEIEITDKDYSLSIIPLNDMIKLVSFSADEKDGRLYFSCKARQVYSKLFDYLYKRETPETITKNGSARNEITQVYLNDTLIWEDGNSISAVTSDLFDAAHPYVGAMPENEKSAMVLHLNVFGNYTNELHSNDKVPNGWEIIYRNKFSLNREAFMKKYLTAAAYGLLATLNNLNYISFKYSVIEELGGTETEKVLKVTLEDATKFIGEDIKAVGRDIVKLEKLLNKSGYIEFFDDIFADDKGINYSEKVKEIKFDYTCTISDEKYLTLICMDNTCGGTVPLSVIYVPLENPNGSVLLFSEDFNDDDGRDNLCSSTYSFRFVIFGKEDSNLGMYTIRGGRVVLSSISFFDTVFIFSGNTESEVTIEYNSFKKMINKLSWLEKLLPI